MKPKMYISKDKNQFGFYGYRIVTDDDKYVILSGLCDDYEISNGYVALYYGVSMQQTVNGPFIETYLEDDEGNKTPVQDYMSFSSEE